MNEPTKQGKVLIELLRDRPHKHIAEVGVSGGETAGHLLRNLPGIERYYCIDPWLATPQFAASMPGGQWGLQKTFNRHYRMFLDEVKPHWSKVWVLRTTSQNAAQILPSAFFDCVFLDADKLDLENDLWAWERVVAPGGILAGHDYNAREEWPVAEVLASFFPGEDCIHTEPDYVWWVEID